jgi:hypothetical protein
MSFIPRELTVSLRSDSDGLIGRQCPRPDCKCYFKVSVKHLESFTGSEMYCVKCGIKKGKNQFLTIQQKEYLKSVAARYILNSIGQQLKQFERKPNPNAFFSIGISVNYNLPEIRRYVEKELKRNVVCSKCESSYALYGISFFCPFCGKRKPIDVFNENSKSIKKFLEMEKLLDVSTVDTFNKEGVLTQITESALKQSVTIFETYCKDKYVEEKLKVSKDKSKEHILRQIGTSFQNIDRATQLFLEFGFDLRNCVSQNEIARLKTGFEKRHVLTHNSGIIDYRYVKEIGGNETDVGNRIILTNDEVCAIISNLHTIISNIESFFQTSNSLQLI